MRQVGSGFRAIATVREKVQGLVDTTAHAGAPLAVLEKLARQVPGLARPVGVVHRALARYSDRRARQFDGRHGTDTFSRARMTDLGCTDEAGKDFDGWM